MIISNVRRRPQAMHNAVWKGLRAGLTHSDIGRMFNVQGSTIRKLIRDCGGIMPPVPVRRPGALTLEDREEILRGIAANRTFREMGERLGRPASTIWREVNRNGGRCKYSAARADEHAWLRAKRPKACKLALNPELNQSVERMLREDWSPQQIAARLKAHYPDSVTEQISHESIYRSLFVQARGALKKELVSHLRTHRTQRKTRKDPGTIRGGIPGAISIRERPAEAQDRAIPGHWEGDLIIGSKSSQVATLVERSSRLVLLKKLPSRDCETVANALTETIQTLPESLRRSLTWDRGSEMARHREISVATDIGIFFCDPGSPWQRGSNENTNGLLRQYLPKGTDLSKYSQAELDGFADRLNQRPRKTLGYRSPASVYQSFVALTV